MEEQDMKEQKNNNSESFNKQTFDKSNDIKEKSDKTKKKIRIIKKIVKVISLLIHMWPIIMVIGVVIFLAASNNFLFGDHTENATEAKSKGVNLSLAQGYEFEEGQKGITISYGNGAYNISTNLEKEELQEIRDELARKGIDTKKFTDFEIEVIGALMKNGLKVDNFESEELKCLPLFIKAEACTGYLDLRPNSQKFDSSGNYKPLSIDSLDENQIPGTILVQRTNTNKGSTILEYKNEEEFNKLVSSNSSDATNYFTINEKGNLVIATWKYTKVEVNGEYPEGVIQTEPEEIYTIDPEEISYNELVKKYKLPFDFLIQLLFLTHKSDFPQELATIALDSKIVINIQEEETITQEIDVQTYDVHKKEEKILNYEVKLNVEVVEKQDEYILVGKNEDGTDVKDDEGHDCTTYSHETKEVTVTTTNTSHTYSCGILEADTWLARYLKTYKTPEKKETSYEPQKSDILGDYGEPDKTEVITNEEIVSNGDLQDFKVNKEGEYRKEIVKPKINVSEYIEQSTGKNYKQIEIEEEDKFDQLPPTDKYYEEVKKDKDGNIANKYNLPSNFAVITKPNGKIPKITFKYGVMDDDTYKLMAPNLDNFVKCNISKLQIKEYSKIDEHHYITKSRTEYLSDSNPEINTHIYAKNEQGEFEKFLEIYDKNKSTQGTMNSTGHWLFREMKNNENTVDLVDSIKYLLYEYDGTDYGITELDTSIFEPDEMHIAKGSNSFDQFIKYLHSWEGGGTIYKNDEGINCYRVNPDGGAVGYGVDIATHGAKLRSLGYDTSPNALIPIEVVDEIEKESIQEIKEEIESITSELNLTQYQIYALISRCYNYGITGGLKQATYQYKYPSSETFLSAYKKYYKDINNDDYYGAETTFSNKLYTEYMTWLDYADTGDHPPGWEYRRRSEWSLFQTGYYGYDLKYGTGHGIDEYYTGVSSSTDFTNNINLYNVDETVNERAIDDLEDWITEDLLKTQVHDEDWELGLYQTGPFEKWWDAANNWFTSEGLEFQCTWYVYGRANQFLELYGTTYKSWPGSKNDAKTWYKSNTNGGENYFECGIEPRPNSIAVWTSGDWGHVAYVEAVDTINNNVYISHAALGTKWHGIEAYTKEEMKTLYGYTLLGYVYLDSPKK